MPEIKEYIGNKELLKLHKIAFLCSRKVPASIVLKCYDWAIAQRDAGNCIISGFHSQLEKDVLHYLLKGKQPIIVVLARGIKQTIEPEWQSLLDSGRLLIITPFAKDIKRVTEATATVRNRLMIEIADDVLIGYASKDGGLNKLIQTQIDSKVITYL